MSISISINNTIYKTCQFTRIAKLLNIAINNLRRTLTIKAHSINITIHKHSIIHLTIRRKNRNIS